MSPPYRDLGLLWAALLLLAGCTPSSRPELETPPMRLAPWTAPSHEFSCPEGRCRADYTLLSGEPGSSQRYTQALKALIEQAAQEPAAHFDLYSLYVYRPSPAVLAAQERSAADIRGTHDGDLVAFARYTHSQLDTLYLIDGGRVVYDLVLDRQVDPPWEFD